MTLPKAFTENFGEIFRLLFHFNYLYSVADPGGAKGLQPLHYSLEGIYRVVQGITNLNWDNLS